MRRTIAAQMGLNIVEFNKLGEKPENVHEFDLKYEEYQKNLDPQGAIILESRLGFWCQPKSFKIFLTVDEEMAAQRIFNQKRETDHYNSREEVYEETKRRNQEDIDRYQNLYGFNYQDSKNFDLILDTTGKTTEETVEIILQKFQDWQQ
ncbi:TPA: hypothetical protein DEP21_06535 [Patescibacteria group bacterium]|nr:hypothetical protein [Candidatus Gracilibacteria bacterium]